ncbi:MAG: SsrA-binding protein [Proteobacteria bacterium]|nr:MAG: SsrA-binding protein [Pseudomonadota bacterium]
MGKRGKSGGDKPGHKTVTRNRQAFRNYFIEDRFEVGMVLRGSEVKSLREGRVNLGDAYGEIRGGELWLLKCHISPYENASYNNHEPMRERKLLIHKQQIKRLTVKLRERGYTLVPLSIYFKEGWAKVELGLGKGKKLHDKRDAVRERDIKRDVAKEASERR